MGMDNTEKDWFAESNRYAVLLLEQALKTEQDKEILRVQKIVANGAILADFVEVVRCKDCKYWECWRNSGEGSGDCLLDEGYQTLATQHYDFCSYGERRNDV